MSTFAEREGFHGFQNTSRVLQCWLYYGATVNGWGSGLDHARWERFATESPPRNNSISKSVEPFTMRYERMISLVVHV